MKTIQELKFERAKKLIAHKTGGLTRDTGEKLDREL